MLRISQVGNTAHQAYDGNGLLLSSHVRQDKAIEAVAQAGGGEVHTVQTLRVSLTDAPDPEPEPEPEPEPTPKLWGASIRHNGNPAKHEDPAGVPLQLRRTFWQWRHHENEGGNLFATARTDVASGRVPWVSTKTPPWAEFADGRHDDRLRHLFATLADIDGPVWFTIHHEPENNVGNDGSIPNWLAMQHRTRQVLDEVGACNVTFAANLMGYTWTAGSRRNPDEWWADDVWDVFTANMYRDNGTSILDYPGWLAFRQWCRDRNTPYGIGEYGMIGAADDVIAEHLTGVYDEMMADPQWLAASYFDSDVGSRDWQLSGLRAERFQHIMQVHHG